VQAGASLTPVLTTLHAQACVNRVPGGYSPNPLTIAKMISSLMCKTRLEVRILEARCAFRWSPSMWFLIFWIRIKSGKLFDHAIHCNA
jgi:hypothetical protein